MYASIKKIFFISCLLLGLVEWRIVKRNNP